MTEPDRPVRPVDLGIDGDPATAARPVEASRRTAPRSASDVARTAVVGAMMGTVELVPGFSSGTVALLTGIYPRLIANVRQGARTLSLLVRGRLGDGGRAFAAIEWGFVLGLLTGVALALLTVATTIRGLLETRPQTMNAVFLGLVVGATIVACRELRAPAPRHLAVAAPVAAATFLLVGLRTGEAGDPSLLWLFLAGFVAISAMILPGISGAFVLLLLGVYEPVLGYLDDLVVVPLAVLAVSFVVGLAATSTLLNWLLRRHHDVVLAALLGLMAGSARVLWPWPSDGAVGDPQLGAPVGDEIVVVAALVVGAVVAVLVAATLARRLGGDTEGLATAGHGSGG